MKVSIFLSTDGKHTVNVENEDPEKAYEIAKGIYDSIIEDYGSQTEQRMKAAKTEMSKPENFTESIGMTPTTTPICEVHKVAMVWHEAGVSVKTGKHYNAFWSCQQKNPDGSFCTYRPK